MNRDPLNIPRKQHTVRILTVMPRFGTKNITERFVKITLAHVSMIDGRLQERPQ